MEITQELAGKVLEVVDCGLSSGLGRPVPGEMCVEAAVNFALGNEHGDNPKDCVDQVLRSFKICLNDKNWSRARGMRRLAIAQLGTAGNFDSREFSRRLSDMTIRKIVPRAIAVLLDKAPEPHKSALIAASERCEKEGTRESARAANEVLRKYRAAYAADAAAYAADAAAYAADKVLADFAEAVVQILIDMKTPGSKYLFLTECDKAGAA